LAGKLGIGFRTLLEISHAQEPVGRSVTDDGRYSKGIKMRITTVALKVVFLFGMLGLTACSICPPYHENDGMPLAAPSAKAQPQPQQEHIAQAHLRYRIWYPVDEDNCTQERDCTCGACPPYQDEWVGVSDGWVSNE